MSRQVVRELVCDGCDLTLARSKHADYPPGWRRLLITASQGDGFTGSGRRMDACSPECAARCVDLTYDEAARWDPGARLRVVRGHA